MQTAGPDSFSSVFHYLSSINTAISFSTISSVVAQLAANRTVCTISLIHSQIKDIEAVVTVLSDELDMEPEQIRKKAEKVTAREIVKTNVEKSVGDRIRELDLAGVKVDEDYKRYYPFGSLASKVLGFTGADNQGIIGLEVSYDEILQGISGSILTYTDAAG